jgi:DNA gyrase subunit A
VENEDELMLITQQGKVLRMDTKDIRPIGRATQGVRLIEMDDQDQVVSLARLIDVADGAEAGSALEPDPS